MRPIAHCHLVNGPLGDPVMYAEIMFERRALLFDIGDVTALAPRKLLRVSHVFVSHTHMDHFAGFDHLVRLLLGRDKTVSLHGPAGFIEQVERKLHAYTWNVVRSYPGNLVLDVHEVHEDGTALRARFDSRCAFRRQAMPGSRIEDDLLATCGALQVRCQILDHGTPCLAFALEEPVHVNIWKPKLDELGLEVGPWLRELRRAVLAGLPDDAPVQALRRTEGRTLSVTLPLGSLRGVARIVAGQKFAYVVDTRSNETNAARIERLASGADVLFIECPFLEADAAHAARRNHLTAWQAGLLARRAGVKRLVPCHFSPRYPGRGEMLAEEAERAFRGHAAQEPPRSRRNPATTVDNGAAGSSENS